MIPLTSCKKTLDILLTKNKHAFEIVSIFLKVQTFRLTIQKWSETRLERLVSRDQFIFSETAISSPLHGHYTCKGLFIYSITSTILMQLFISEKELPNNWLFYFFTVFQYNRARKLRLF